MYSPSFLPSRSRRVIRWRKQCCTGPSMQTLQVSRFLLDLGHELEGIPSSALVIFWNNHPNGDKSCEYVECFNAGNILPSKMVSLKVRCEHGRWTDEENYAKTTFRESLATISMQYLWLSFSPLGTTSIMVTHLYCWKKQAALPSFSTWSWFVLGIFHSRQRAPMRGLKTCFWLQLKYSCLITFK